MTRDEKGRVRLTREQRAEAELVIERMQEDAEAVAYEYVALRSQAALAKGERNAVIEECAAVAEDLQSMCDLPMYEHCGCYIVIAEAIRALHREPAK